MRTLLICASLLALCLATAASFSAPVLAAAENDKIYVGAEACESCHPDQYASFSTNSRKAHSWKSIEKMAPKLKDSEVKECYACHTTGYGKPGGFESLSRTPHLANVGCEACHGPGNIHAESGDPADIKRRPDMAACTACHNAERVDNFNFKPMLYHGGH